MSCTPPKGHHIPLCFINPLNSRPFNASQPNGDIKAALDVSPWTTLNSYIDYKYFVATATKTFNSLHSRAALRLEPRNGDLSQYSEPKWWPLFFTADMIMSNTKSQLLLEIVLNWPTAVIITTHVKTRRRSKLIRNFLIEELATLSRNF